MNMASFFPVFVMNKFNKHIKLNETHFVKQISTVQISLCIVSFELACVLSTFVHSKTIHLMGRKNAVMIGFIIQIISVIGLALLGWVPADYPQTFVWANIATRFIQGYGDSLTLTTCYSIVALVYQDDKAEKIGITEATFGFGLMLGPPVGSIIFG